jgi:hypothetical protein
VLAEADKADRQRELAGNGHHDPPRCAIELGNRQARHTDRGVELLGLGQRVLPWLASSTSSTSCGAVVRRPIPA